MTSILQDWVTALGLRHQGTLLAAVRGCDGVGKHDVSKILMRGIRCVCLVPFDARELTEAKGFFYYEPIDFRAAVEGFAKNMDEYPVHFVLHVVHALEVIGYWHPDFLTRNNFLFCYKLIVRKMHLNPETKQEMEARLWEDRVANNTVVT